MESQSRSTECWIMSHLSSVQRWKLLKKAIHSVANQTCPPDAVRLSYSCGKEITTKQVFDDLTSEFASIKSIQLFLYPSEEQLTQIEHMVKIHNQTSNEGDYIVFFLDDDDESHPRRFEIMTNELRKNGCDFVWSDYAIPIIEQEELYASTLEWDSIPNDTETHNVLKSHSVWSAEGQEMATMCVKRRLISEYVATRNPEERNFTEDRCFVEFVTKNYTGMHVLRKLYLYRKFWSGKLISVIHNGIYANKRIWSGRSGGCVNTNSFEDCEVLYDNKNAIEFMKKEEGNEKYIERLCKQDEIIHQYM